MTAERHVKHQLQLDVCTITLKAINQRQKAWSRLCATSLTARFGSHWSFRDLNNTRDTAGFIRLRVVHITFLFTHKLQDGTRKNRKECTSARALLVIFNLSQHLTRWKKAQKKGLFLRAGTRWTIWSQTVIILQSLDKSSERVTQAPLS